MDKDKLKTNIDWALYYHSLGWSVIPITPKNKHPLFAWKKYQTERADIKQLKEWWSKQPDANIGIITGKISGIVVVDTDKGKNISGLAPTVTAITGSGVGRHYIYKHPGFNTGCPILEENIDFKGDGGLIVVSPSIHPSGNLYEWHLGPGDIEIAELPEIIRERVKAKTQTDKKDWNKISKGVSEGSRNKDATSYIGKLLRDNSQDLWPTSMWEMIVNWNKKCSPPMSIKELQSIFVSISNRERQRREEKENLVNSVKGQGKAFLANKIAEYFLNKYHIITIKEDRSLFVYRDGIYVRGENILKAECEKLLDIQAETKVKNEIIDKIKDKTYQNDFKEEQSLNLINLKNGLYDLKTKELLSHDPKEIFFTRIPISYLPNADCPSIKKFLKEVSGDNEKIIQEWLGFILYRRYFIKKAIIFVGERNTGKTTLMNLLAKFIGHKNMSGISLQDLTKERFHSANLFNKHLNVYDDLSSRDIVDNGKFKIATGDGYMSGEFKHQTPFEFKNYAKLMFACNKIPDVEDMNDDAYFERWIIVEFKNQIKKPNPFLFDKLTKENELAGLFNYALKGLSRLLDNKRFSYDKDPYEIKREMMRWGSVVSRFTYDYLEEEVGAWISKDEMYDSFCSYSQHHGFTPVTKEDFGSKIKQYASYVDDSKSTMEDSFGFKDQKTGWRHVKIKSQS